MAIYEVYKTVCGNEMIYAIEADSAEAALSKFRYEGAGGFGVREARHNLPTVREAFALVDEIKAAVKEPRAGIRQNAKNFRRALNNWAEWDFFGNNVKTPGEYYKAISDFELSQIPPEATEMWAGLVEAARLRGIVK